jgi:hypothetical protein
LIAIRVSGILASVAYLLYFGLFVQLHIKNKEYDMRDHALSDYAIGSTAKLFNFYVLIGNAAAVFLSIAFLILQASQPHYLRVALLLLAMVFCRTLLGVFKTDIEGQKMTIPGILHYLFAIGNFAFAYMAIDAADSNILNQSSIFGNTNAVAIIFVVLTTTLVLVCITMFKPFRKFFGIIERLYILITALWFFGASLLVAINGKI